MTEMGVCLRTYTDFTRMDFDAGYAKTHQDREYEEVESEADEVFQEANIAYLAALEAAEQAGITELPLSPISLASKSEDGKAGTMGSTRIKHQKEAAEKKEQRLRRWIRSTFKLGKPPGDCRLRRKGSFPKDMPKWSQKIMPGLHSSGDDSPTKEGRIRKKRRNEKGMRKKFIAQRDRLAQELRYQEEKSWWRFRCAVQ